MWSEIWNQLVKVYLDLWNFMYYVIIQILYGKFFSCTLCFINKFDTCHSISMYPTDKSIENQVFMSSVHDYFTSMCNCFVYKTPDVISIIFTPPTSPYQSDLIAHVSRSGWSDVAGLREPGFLSTVFSLWTSYRKHRNNECF